MALKMSKEKRKGLSLPQPLIQPDARIVLSLGKHPQDLVVSVKGRYGWIPVGLIKNLQLSAVTSKLRTDFKRQGCTITDPFKLEIELHAPKKLDKEDQLYVEYAHNLLQGKPTEDEEDIKNEQKNQPESLSE